MPPEIVTIVVENNNSCKITVTAVGKEGSVQVKHQKPCEDCADFGKSAERFKNALCSAYSDNIVCKNGMSQTTFITHMAKLALGIPDAVARPSQVLD